MGTTVDYTVLLLYPDYLSSDFGQETFLAWVTTWQGLDEAVYLARIKATEAQPEPSAVIDLTDFFVLAVFEGHHVDIWTREPEGEV